MDEIVSTWVVEDFEDRARELGVTAEELMKKTRKVFNDRLTEEGNEIISNLIIWD